MTRAFVGIGSNLEEPVKQVGEAFEELDRLPGTRVLERSSLYRSAPLGYAGQPDFVNAVAGLDTGMSAEALLSALLDIEARHGRRRSFANAPRTLDLDLLLYGNSVFDSKTLKLPHPRMHERAFVLRPLLEIAPGIEIPGLGSADALLEKLRGQAVERIA